MDGRVLYEFLLFVGGLLFFSKNLKKVFQSSKNLATLLVRIPLQSTNDGQKWTVQRKVGKEKRKLKKVEKFLNYFFKVAKTLPL